MEMPAPDEAAKCYKISLYVMSVSQKIDFYSLLSFKLKRFHLCRTQEGIHELCTPSPISLDC